MRVCCLLYSNLIRVFVREPGLYRISVGGRIEHSGVHVGLFEVVENWRRTYSGIRSGEEILAHVRIDGGCHVPRFECIGIPARAIVVTLNAALRLSISILIGCEAVRGIEDR